MWGRNGFTLLLGIAGMVICLGTFGQGMSRAQETASDNASRYEEGSKGRKDATGRSDYSLDALTVTATKTETPAEMLPVTAYTVDQEDIEAQPEHYINNFGELIRDLPGVHVAQYYPWGPPWVHLRGTGYFIGRTVYLVDRVPVSPFLSPTISNEDIERVDVLLGPSSALYGANASGGAVNIVTKRGTKETGGKVSLGYGSHNTFRPHVSVGDETEEGFHYYLSYSGDYSDGYEMKPVKDMLRLYHLGKRQYLKEASVEDNEYEHSYFSGKVGWENQEGAGFWLGYNYQDLYLSGGQKNLILNDDGTQGIGNFRAYAPVGDIAKVTLYASHQYLDRPQKYNKGLSLVDGNLVLDEGRATSQEWRIERIPLELQTDFYLGSSDILTAGFFFSREDEERETNNWVTGENQSRTKYTTDQTAFYLQNQLFLLDDKLSLLAGLRYDRWNYHDVFDKQSTPQTPEGFSKDHVTYRGAIKYRFNDWFAVRSSAGTAFWPGTATWFFQNTTSGNSWREANPDLKPEKTWMADLGFEISLSPWGTFLGVTPYYGRIKDMVSYRYDTHPTLDGVSIIRTQNLGEAEIYGIEFSVDQKITNELSAFAGLTLNHSEIKDDPVNEGNQLRNAPDYFGSVGVRYLNPVLFNSQVTFRFSDDRFYDDENTELPYFHMSAYETVDAKIWRDWKIAEKLVLSTGFSANNLFDEEYETEIVYMHPGRTFQADIGIKYLF